MTSPDTARIAAALAGSEGALASVEHITEQVIISCEGIDQALVPIIGQRGMAALYRRALHLTRSDHPWLPPDTEGVPSVVDLLPLRAALLLQNPSDAALGGAALLANFHQLLTSLVGRPLTERLLRSVWMAYLTHPFAQDTLP